jgi:hypothetical protein
MIRTRFLNGLCIYGKLPFFKKRYIDIQLFSITRSFSYGITFFRVRSCLDLWKAKPCPKFEFEITILNVYNCFIIHS